LEKFRRKIEEYKATMFVLELGTARPISPRRMDENLAEKYIPL